MTPPRRYPAPLGPGIGGGGFWPRPRLGEAGHGARPFSKVRGHFEALWENTPAPHPPTQSLSKDPQRTRSKSRTQLFGGVSDPSSALWVPHARSPHLLSAPPWHQVGTCRESSDFFRSLIVLGNAGTRERARRTEVPNRARLAPGGHFRGGRFWRIPFLRVPEYFCRFGVSGAPGLGNRMEVPRETSGWREKRGPATLG